MSWQDELLDTYGVMQVQEAREKYDNQENEWKHGEGAGCLDLKRMDMGQM